MEHDVETEHYCCEQNSVGHIQAYCGRFGSCLLILEAAPENQGVELGQTNIAHCSFVLVQGTTPVL